MTPGIPHGIGLHGTAGMACMAGAGTVLHSGDGPIVPIGVDLTDGTPGMDGTTDTRTTGPVTRVAILPMADVVGVTLVDA